MKKSFIFILVAAFLGILYLYPSSINAEPGQNLVANPSVEIVSSSSAGSPEAWTPNSWGSLDAEFSYENAGNTGSRSVRVDVANYTSGDAKWYFSPVNVQAGKSYTYSTYYKSSSSSQIVVQLKDSSGAISYKWLKSAPASANWQQISAEYIAPANAASATIFHVINSNGFLQTDDTYFGLTDDGTTGEDTIPPTTTITSPASGATVSGSQVVTADASDNKEVTQVQFKVDGVNTGNPDTTAPYSLNWDSTTAANGNHELTAVATDSSGLSTTSTVVSVIVDNQTTPPPTPSGDNLIPNPSLETANGNVPAAWITNQWGDLTTSFTYPSSGQDGNRSVRAEVTSHTSGDAKWYFNPVNIEAGTEYTYSHYYKSNASTQFVFAYQNNDNTWSYNWIETVPSSASWKKHETTFTPPAQAAKVTVFHVIDKVGWIQLDNASLAENVDTEPNPDPDPEPDTGVVPNASVENSDGGTPTSWTNNSWGSNTANFEYLNEGRTGVRSVKVTVSDHQNGDAKWYFNPITSLESEGVYSFSASYRTNTEPKVVAMFNKTDGTTQYVGLPNPIPGSNSTTVWQQYSNSFSVPANTSSASILFIVNSNGWLQTDDYSITDYNAVGFNRPLLTLTFDDGQEDNVNTALPVMNSYGFKSTQCFATEYIEGNQDQVDRVLQFRDDGHEICSHTVSHPFLTSLSAQDLEYELTRSKEYLESITGQTIRNFATPYGDYNSTVVDAIDNLYRSHRTVDQGYNSKDNFNIYKLRVQNMLDTTTVEDVQGWVEQAQADNTWLVLVYHRIGQNPGPYDNSLAQFESHMEAINNSGITVKTYNDALDEVLPQL